MRDTLNQNFTHKPGNIVNCNINEKTLNIMSFVSIKKLSCLIKETPNYRRILDVPMHKWDDELRP